MTTKAWLMARRVPHLAVGSRHVMSMLEEDDETHRRRARAGIEIEGGVLEKAAVGGKEPGHEQHRHRAPLEHASVDSVGGQ